MHSFFTLRRIFIFSIGLIGFFSACTRISSTDIGGGLIPDIDGVTTKDTLLDVITDSFGETDTARIYKQDLHVLGAITNDPLFGRTTAALNFELGTVKSQVTGFEVGFLLDAYINKVVLMPTATNKNVYPTIFFTLFYGTRN